MVVVSVTSLVFLVKEKLEVLQKKKYKGLSIGNSLLYQKKKTKRYVIRVFEAKGAGKYFYLSLTWFSFKSEPRIYQKGKQELSMMQKS